MYEAIIDMYIAIQQIKVTIKLSVQCRCFLSGGGGVECSGIGCGQTRSRQSGGQNSLILSNKYCCRLSESPGGGMMGGRSVVVGFQLLSCIRFISLSGLVTESLTITQR